MKESLDNMAKAQFRDTLGAASGAGCYDTPKYNEQTIKTPGSRAKRAMEQMEKEIEYRQAEAHSRHCQLVDTQLQALGGATIATVDGLGQIISGFMQAQGFWDSENTGEKFMLMVSEIGEAMEADRKDLPSDKIPGFTGVEEELADAVIRILDFAGHHDLRLGEAIITKMRMNLHRPYKHGKKY